jgi:hypothetical protein
MVTAALALAGCGQPMTRGDVQDRLARDAVTACADGYGAPTPAIWLMCLEVVSEQNGRDPAKVRELVIAQRGAVF